MQRTRIDKHMNRFPFTLNGYEFLCSIGKGGTASVFKVMHLASRKYFAAKVINCSKCNMEKRKMEIECMMKLYHPNIIKIYDAFEVNDNLFMIIEFCEKGSLKNMINNGAKFSEKQILQIMKQILTALNYCHKKGIAHCDIKPENIFVTKDGMFKLGDFGLGFDLTESSTSENFSGSFVYKAPELVMRKRFSPLLADIWSLGVTFYFISTGEIPWAKNQILMEKMIVNGVYDIPKSMTSTVSYIIWLMLKVSPECRPTTEDLLSLKCFTTMNNTKLDFSVHNAFKMPHFVKPIVKPPNRRFSNSMSISVSMPLNGIVDTQKIGLPIKPSYSSEVLFK